MALKNPTSDPDYPNEEMPIEIKTDLVVNYLYDHYNEGHWSVNQLSRLCGFKATPSVINNIETEIVTSGLVFPFKNAYNDISIELVPHGYAALSPFKGVYSHYKEYMLEQREAEEEETEVVKRKEVEKLELEIATLSRSLEDYEETKQRAKDAVTWSAASGLIAATALIISLLQLVCNKTN